MSALLLRPVCPSTEGNYNIFFFTGAIPFLHAPSDDYTFVFTHIELYGGTHLAVNGTRTKVETKRIYGDDTAHLHIGPGQTLEINEVTCITLGRYMS